jgi:DNA replication protein DnaC
MAQEITVEEAQANLEHKRRAMGINPSTPSTSKKVSEVVEKSIGLIVPGECYLHKYPLPCPVCDQERQEEQDLFAQREQERKKKERARLEAEIRERQEHPEKILSKIGIGKRHLSCSFDSYQGGDKIKAACREFLNGPFDLVLSGGAGTGKTHLAVAILRELAKAGQLCREYINENIYHITREDRGLFVSVPELLAKIRATYSDSNSDEETLIDTYASVKYLVLDDLGAEKTTEWSITTLYLIIDRRYREMLPTIVTTNLSLDEIGQSLSRRIASRLASGKVITIKAPDYRAKRSA